MLKGTQRRVVEIRLSGSKLYESACFFLRQGVGAEQKGEAELISEARALVGALVPPKRKRRKAWVERLISCLVSLLIGGAIGFALSLLF